MVLPTERDPRTERMAALGERVHVVRLNVHRGAAHCAAPAGLSEYALPPASGLPAAAGAWPACT